ncbi:hypothetical protein KBW71_00815 [Hydrogenophaga aromaticivorans]|uniref:hypothetical protein n=1 Tax=Hydrogenophaga aromaticivorans TaxID=2610898 RepID=UPI001B380562|nr:hypothetical protein [Hydrogenophaga aromaticivorans]MBQ0916993.1 hypothetical protein [Hydrogenophaga aromaticivorans]MBU4337823.1 hypothetical protein [Actinomycetota bacterium]
MPFVITHPTRGIFLAMCQGVCFWSQSNPQGQDAACAFENTEEAEEFMDTWTDGRPDGVAFVPIVPDLGSHASPEACEAAGLARWNPWAPDVDAEAPEPGPPQA